VNGCGYIVAYTRRKAAFKQIDSAIGNLDTALYHLDLVRSEYADLHPEIAEPIERVMVLILQCLEFAKQIRKGF